MASVKSMTVFMVARDAIYLELPDALKRAGIQVTTRTVDGKPGYTCSRDGATILVGATWSIIGKGKPHEQETIHRVAVWPFYEGLFARWFRRARYRELQSDIGKVLVELGAVQTTQ